jgi:cytochrome c-type biogenesis protein CcmH
MRRFFFAFTLMVFCTVSQSLMGQSEPSTQSEPEVSITSEDFREVASGLRCPTCTGLSVLDSDAPFSVQIKNEVKEQMAVGKKKSEILQFFTERYGPWILREPPKQGINLWAWIIPTGILLLGPVLIWYLVWNRGHTSQKSSIEEDYEPMPLEEIITTMNRRLEELRGRNGESS